MIGSWVLSGAVYIFENPEAQRVKVGMTISGIDLRLRDVNDMWLGRRVTCQICGRRLNNVRGHVPPHPKHFVPGGGCPGGNALPLEKDIALAESRLIDLKARHGELSGSGKGSATRIIKTLEKRIELYRRYGPPVGVWQFRICFYTDCAEEVELLSHEILTERLDRAAPFGEIFCCSVTEATEAVESALSRLGLIDSAAKQASPNRPLRRPYSGS
jgi:hypothetical protein